MKYTNHLLLGLTILASQQSAPQSDRQQRISLLTYDFEQQASDLNCTLTRRGTGYIDYDHAWATIAGVSDSQPVFAQVEAYAEVYDSESTGEAAALCNRVNEIKAAAAANGGIIAVSKTVELSIFNVPSYGPTGCQRYLHETVTVRVAPGLELVSAESEAISTTNEDCRNEK
jgi:hypothetical protein